MATAYPGLDRTRTILIPVTAAFGGLAMFIAMFVVASTLGLSIQQREREIALMRAVAATPGQIRRMIAWEAAIVALIGSAAGIWPGIVLGRALERSLVGHGIMPPNLAPSDKWLPAAAAITGAVAIAIAATALLPLSHAFTGGLRPYAPAGWLAAILGVSALLALVAPVGTNAAGAAQQAGRGNRDPGVSQHGARNTRITSSFDGRPQQVVSGPVSRKWISPRRGAGGLNEQRPLSGRLRSHGWRL